MGTNTCAHSFLREAQFDAFGCDGCQEIGYGSCYTCTNGCNYHLHKACQNAPPAKFHPLYSQGQFVLDRSMLPPNNHQGLPNLCAACNTIVEGWRYVLTINVGYTIFLHPCCMSLSQTNLHMRVESINCTHCQSAGLEGVKGWAYINNGVAVHVKCMKDMLQKDWETRNCSPSNEYYGTTQECELGGRGRLRKRDRFKARLKRLGRFIIDLDSIGLLDPVKEAWGL